MRSQFYTPDVRINRRFNHFAPKDSVFAIPQYCICLSYFFSCMVRLFLREQMGVVPLGLGCFDICGIVCISKRRIGGDFARRLADQCWKPKFDPDLFNSASHLVPMGNKTKRESWKHGIVIISLFTKLPWPGDSEGTFLFSSQAATCQLYAVAVSHCPFQCWTSRKEVIKIDFYSLWFDPTANRTRVYLFSCSRSVHSTTGQ